MLSLDTVGDLHADPELQDVEHVYSTLSAAAGWVGDWLIPGIFM